MMVSPAPAPIRSRWPPRSRFWAYVPGATTMLSRADEQSKANWIVRKGDPWEQVESTPVGLTYQTVEARAAGARLPRNVADRSKHPRTRSPERVVIVAASFP